jgi:hypothetical protein
MTLTARIFLLEHVLVICGSYLVYFVGDNLYFNSSAAAWNSEIAAFEQSLLARAHYAIGSQMV